MITKKNKHKHLIINNLKKIFFIIIPLFISCSKENTNNLKLKSKSIWITDAFETILSGNYPKIKAIAWWNENFDKSFLRIDSSTESLLAYQNGAKSDIFTNKAILENNKLVAYENKIYHSAFPDFGGTEDIVTAERIAEFEQLADKEIAWAYFSNNWLDKIKFPANDVNTIKNTGKIPYIRMMARSEFNETGADKEYSLQNIIDGKYDAELVQWAIDAKNTNIPLLVEFGTEANGDWFPWNAKYNGANSTNYGDTIIFDGAERFVDAYRHIIDICRANNANNITWFFHIDSYSQPDADWNKIELYYPGDDYIDWLGVSIYGVMEKGEEYISFSDIMKDIYPKLTAISDKPVAVLEFGVSEM